MKTPEEIAIQAATEFDTLPSSGDELVQLIAKGIEADRAQLRATFVDSIDSVLTEAEESEESDSFDAVFEARNSATDLLASIRAELVKGDQS